MIHQPVISRADTRDQRLQRGLQHGFVDQQICIARKIDQSGKRCRIARKHHMPAGCAKGKCKCIYQRWVQVAHGGNRQPVLI